MRAVLVVLVVALVLAGCGDDGPSKEERVAEVCEAWQSYLDADHSTPDESRAAALGVARVALESESELTFVGMELSDSLDPWDEARFRRAAAGMEQSCR